MFRRPQPEGFLLPARQLTWTHSMPRIMLKYACVILQARYCRTKPCQGKTRYSRKRHWSQVLTCELQTTKGGAQTATRAPY